MLKFLLKALVVALLVLPFTACFRKKAGSRNLQQWLDKHYPGKFEVLSTSTDDAIRNLSFKVKTSLVGEKANPLVQYYIKWDKRAPDLNLTTDLVDTAFAQAASYYQDARELLQILQAQGLEPPCVSLKNGTATILLFHEPTVEFRAQCLASIEKAFQAWPKSGSYDKEILLMEKAAQAGTAGEILPISYFMDRQYLKAVTYRFQLPYNQPFSGENLGENWSFNTASDQFAAAHEKARKAMETWAAQHYGKPYFVMDTSEFEQTSEKPLRYRFKFAFTHHEQPENSTDYVEPDGYFVVNFDIDKNEALKITTDFTNLQ